MHSLHSLSDGGVEWTEFEMLSGAQATLLDISYRVESACNEEKCYLSQCCRAFFIYATREEYKFYTTKSVILSSYTRNQLIIVQNSIPIKLNKVLELLLAKHIDNIV